MAYPSVIDWKMKEIESKGVASDQINGGSLMRFVKQRRSRSLGVQSRLSNLGLRGDRYYWSEVLLGKKKSPLCPLDSWDSTVPFILPRLLHIFYRKKIHAHTDTSSCPTSWMDVILSDLSPSSSCVPSRKLAHNPSLPPCHLYFVPTILIAGLHLTLYSSCLWVSEPLRPPTSLSTPKSHDTPFILSLLRLCHCLHHTLQGAAVNIWLYPAQNSSAIRADLKDYVCSI